MRAHYDSAANAISIELIRAEKADLADQVHARAVVAVRDGKPVELQLLYPDLGLAEPLALAAPDRSVSMDVAGRSAA